MADTDDETQEITPTPEPEPEVTPEPEAALEPEPEVTPKPEPEKPIVQEPTGMLDIFPVEDTSLSNLNIFPDEPDIF